MKPATTEDVRHAIDCLSQVEEIVRLHDLVIDSFFNLDCHPAEDTPSAGPVVSLCDHVDLTPFLEGSLAELIIEAVNNERLNTGEDGILSCDVEPEEDDLQRWKNWRLLFRLQQQVAEWQADEATLDFESAKRRSAQQAADRKRLAL